MIHFTMTGYYSGVPFCMEKRNDEDEYRHVPHVMTVEKLKELMNQPDFCPACRKAWEEV